jgi:large-conductance mechanosensitive channel
LIEKVDYNKQGQEIRNILRLEIIKGYILLGKILSSLKKYSIELRNNFLKDHLNKTLNLTKKIFELFQDDEDVIDNLLKFYTENASAIGGNCQESFDLFNNIMINYYLSSGKHFKALNTLRLLYLSYLISDDNTNELYFQKNKNILDQYSLIMDTFINNISKEKDINSNMTDKIEDISDFHHYIFHKLSFNSPIITRNNNDLIKYYNFIEKVINFFINCVNLFMNLNNSSPVGERILSSIIKSFDAFFVNISLSREFLAKQNNNNSCFVIDIILSLWNLIKCKQFNSSGRKQLILCYFNAIAYDINLFKIAFEKCLIKSNKFNQVYIKSIIEYIVCFQNDYESIDKMLYLIFNDIQENAEIDERSYSNLFSLVVRKKGLKKVNK